MVFHIVIDADSHKYKVYDMNIKKKEELFDFPELFTFPSFTSFTVKQSVDKLFECLKHEVDIILSKDSIGWIIVCITGYATNETRQIYLNKIREIDGANIKLVNKESIVFYKLIYEANLKLNDEDTVWIFYNRAFYIWQYCENLNNLTFIRLVRKVSSLTKEIIDEIKYELYLKYFDKVYVFESCPLNIWTLINTVFKEKAISVGTDAVKIYNLDKFFYDNIPSLPNKNFTIKCDNGIILNLRKIMPSMFEEAVHQIDFQIENETRDDTDISQIAITKIHILRNLLTEIIEPAIPSTYKAKSLKYFKVRSLHSPHIDKSDVFNDRKIIQTHSVPKMNVGNEYKKLLEELHNRMFPSSSTTKTFPSASTVHQYETVPSILPPLPLRRSLSLQPRHPPPPPPRRRPLPTLSPLTNIPSDPFQKPQIPAALSKYIIPPKITEFKNGINAVGIDLGTSRCCVAVSRRRAFELVAVENTGEKLLPSYVSYDEAHETCGQVVVNKLRGASNSIVFDSKRLIGKTFEEVDHDPSWPFKVVNVNDNVGICVNTHNGIAVKTPEEVSASLLRYIKQKVDEFQGKILTEAVITIPATFTKVQKAATVKAANLAGWTSPTLLPEPVAAAFAYFNDHDYVENSLILLFDLGGGTLDICLFKVVNGQMHVIKECGNDMIGGRDFDRLLIDYFTDRLWNEFKIDVTNDQKKKYRLYSECVNIKHSLSTLMEDRIDVDDFSVDNNNLIPINRKTYEDKAKSLLFKIRTSLTAVFKDTSYRVDQISKVLLVGGGCRMPMIKNLLKSKFPNAHLCCEEKPEEVVATGAAMYAYHLKTDSINHWLK